MNVTSAAYEVSTIAVMYLPKSGLFAYQIMSEVAMMRGKCSV